MKVIAQLYKIIPYQSMWDLNIRTMKDYKLKKSQFLSNPEVETFTIEKNSINVVADDEVACTEAEELWEIEDLKSRDIRLLLSRKETNHKYYLKRKIENN
jgi:hypothetical protein